MPTKLPSPDVVRSSADDPVQCVFPFIASNEDSVFADRVIAGSPAQHAFNVGDWVVIFCVSLFQRPKIEGLGEIVARVPREPDHYFVRFQGETRPRMRRVLAGLYQTHPDTMLEHLIAAWRPTIPQEILAEFFPDDLVPDNDNEEV